MRIAVESFHGIQPRVHPSLLADGMAVRAHNCRLKNGKLVPLRESAPVPAGTRIHMENGLRSIADARTLHAWKHTALDGSVLVDFLAFPRVVSVAEGNIADDEYDRLFVAGDTGLAWTDADGRPWTDAPGVYLYSRRQNKVLRRTIMKSKPPAPVVTLADGETLDDGKTSYFVAFFAAWYSWDGYESPLSDASEILEVNDGMTVRFAPSSYPVDAVGLRIYVSAAGSSEASDGVQFFLERGGDQFTPAASYGFAATMRMDALGEREPGIESPPPDLAHVKYVPGGFYAGASRSMPHTVMFSDIGLVTSWPTAYRYDVKDNIVALAVTSNSVFALTDGYPWVLSGTAPESMTATVLAGPAACVSPLGVCVYRNSVYYASNEGLMVIANSADAGTVCANLTQKIFTKDQWLALNPASCVMGQFDGALRLFFRDAAGRPLDGLTIDLTEGADAVTTHDEAAVAAAVDTRTDTLYYIPAPTREGGE